MKKFEIINGKWIRRIDFGHQYDDNHTVSAAIRISAINLITSNWDFDGRRIFLNAAGGFTTLFYRKDEDAEYRKDLAFLENLIFNS